MQPVPSSTLGTNGINPMTEQEDDMKANYRTWGDGTQVRVYDARTDLRLVLSPEALHAAQKNAQSCAIANQGRLVTGCEMEVFRSTAFQRFAKYKAWRYRVNERARTVQTANDISHEAVQKLAGITIVLKKPTKSTTLRYLRSDQRKRRDTTPQRKNKRHKVYGRSVAIALSFRERA